MIVYHAEDKRIHRVRQFSNSPAFEQCRREIPQLAAQRQSQAGWVRLCADQDGLLL
jgi:hypothetical protein